MKHGQSHYVFYPARQPRWLAGFIASDCIIIMLGRIWDPAGFSLGGLAGVASTRGNSAQLRVYVGHKLTFLSKVRAWVDSLISEIFDSSGKCCWMGLTIFSRPSYVIARSWGPEPEPEVRFNCKRARTENFCLPEKTGICSLDIFQWNVLRRRIPFTFQPRKSFFFGKWRKWYTILSLWRENFGLVSFNKSFNAFVLIFISF